MLELKNYSKLKEELKEYINDTFNNGNLTLENKDDWHHILFNQDYYIIGYIKAENWLKEHGISAFNAIATCQEYEKLNFGDDAIQMYSDAEKTVNMLVYIFGYEVLEEIETKLIAKLEEKEEEEEEEENEF